MPIGAYSVNQLDPWERHEPWRGPILTSAALHGALAVSVIVIGLIHGGPGESWGGAQQGDSAIQAKLVSNASIPLPSTQAPHENVLATESKGLSKPEPVQKQPEPKAIPIPETITKPKPAPIHRDTIQKPKPVETASNVVPYGEGGPVSGPYTMFKSDLGSGGMQFGSAGSFGSRYSWYVDAVRRKISENWLKYEVDPSIHSANRVFVTFDISRTGSPSNVQLSQSSGVPSLDQSAIRALQRIDTFGPLPNDYSGNKVSVEFWFDFKR
jgi:periplasmic protein TonB